MGARLHYPENLEYNKPTMANVRLRLLGSVSMQVGGGWQTWRPEKPYQLLSYLAYQADWVSREQLAFLFWPDRTTEAAKSNLRKVIYRVRQLNLNHLEINRQKLRWLVETDADAFQKAVGEASYADAVELYSGPLLLGFETDDSPEFSDWLAFERERLHSLWREALLEHAKVLAERRQHDKAISLLTPLIHQDTLDEEALGLYMTFLARAGKQVQALRAFDSFEQKLAEELSLEPTSEMRNLVEAVRNAELVDHPQSIKSAAPAATRSDVSVITKPERTLPQAPTPFVGRDFELAEISHLLSDKACRLLTLVGPGGIGKSRLALQTAQEQGERYDQVTFVSLATLNDPDLIPSAIADALGLELTGQDTPLNQLTRHVGDNCTLLVLDNYEHLMAGASVVAELLQRCSELNLLVTSRERLNLQEEWLFQLDGMAYPKEKVTLETARAFDAPHLFEQRARRMQPRFVLSEDNLGAVLDICRFLGGAPLGLELAAAWVRMLSCQEIADELSHNLDFLAEGGQNLAERHQSLRAAFEHSWQLLGSREQTALANLSVFKGGFTKDAAKYVADAPLLILASLVDKSLLRVSATGRYNRHPLIYQYATEKLTENLEGLEELRGKHQRYFLRYLELHSKAFRSVKQKQALDAVEEDLENIRAAWRHALHGQNHAELARAVEPLTRFYQIRGGWLEGLEACRQAEAVFDLAEGRYFASLGSILANKAMLECCLGEADAATESAQQSLELFRRVNATHRAVNCLNTLGILHDDRGLYGQAKAYFSEALAIAEKGGDQERITALLGNLALVEYELGEYETALRKNHTVLERYRNNRDFNGLSITLGNIGDVLLAAGRHQEAEQTLLEALDVAETAGIHYAVPQILLSLGALHVKRRDYKQAQMVAERNLRVSREVSSRRREAESLNALGRVAYLRGDVETAASLLSESLTVARKAGFMPTMLFSLRCIAELEREQGRLAEAVALLSAVHNHAAATQFLNDEVAETLQDLKRQLSAAEIVSATERGKTLEVNAVIEAVLQNYPEAYGAKTNVQGENTC